MNDVLDIHPQDEIFKFDPDEYRRLQRDSPWTREYVVGSQVYHNETNT